MKKEVRLDLIEEIAKSPGYDIALMTTFNYEIDYFERAILNTLRGQGINTISLFVDARELTKSISDVTSCYMGFRYMVNPVSINGAFHPKVVLLLGEDKAKLFVGSNNITTSGYTINNEVIDVIKYSSEHQEYLDVINKAIDFFIGINDLSYQLDDKLIDEIRELPYYHKAPSNDSLLFMHNLQKPLLSQFSEVIEKPVKEIKVAVPYYDNSLAALQEIREIFAKARIEIYLQNRKSRFPKHVFNQKKKLASLKPFVGFLDNDSASCKNFYHGKVFLFKTDTAAYIAYGSANCTRSALTKTHSDGGNIECDLFGIGKPKEFDYFFQNIEVQSDAKLDVQPMSFKEPVPGNYHYKYGEIINDGGRLHIGYLNKKEPEVYLENEKMQLEVTSEELVVIVPEEVIYEVSDIFDIIIKYDDTEETVRCWTFDPEEIKAYRQAQRNQYPVEEFEINSEGDKYLYDRKNILEADALCFADIKDYYKRVAYNDRIKQEVEGEDVKDNDFVIDVEILTDWKREYRQINAVKRIRGLFLGRLTGKDYSLLAYNKQSVNRAKDAIGAESERPGLRPPTTDEKSFERFVKSKVKGMLNRQYVDAITPEHYLGIVAIILDIFIKYRDVEIFDYEYVIETRSDFYINLLMRKSETKNDSSMEEAILRNCLIILRDNYHCSRNTNDLEEKDFIDSINKRLLRAVEKRFSIRSTYRKLYKELVDDDSKGKGRITSENYFKYIERLFGYKNYELLVDYLCSVYGEAEVIIDDQHMKIKACSDNMKKCLKADPDVLREINSFSREVTPIKNVEIQIKSSEHTQKNIAVVEYKISLQYHKLATTITYTNGHKYSEKPEFISV